MTTASTILSIVSDQIMMRWGRDVAVEPEDSFEALGLDELDRREIVMRVEREFRLPRDLHENDFPTVSHLISAVQRSRSGGNPWSGSLTSENILADQRPGSSGTELAYAQTEEPR